MDVVFMVGMPYCGSTFFGRVLNQHSRIFTAGELHYVDESLNENTRDCKCVAAHDKQTCSFWNDIYRIFRRRGGDLAAAARMSQDNRLEWMKAVISPFFPRIAPDFGEQNRLLYEVIAEKSGAEVVVDTSKRIWRGLPLKHRAPFDIHFLHLVKSPENQIYSRIKRGNSFWHSAILKYWRKQLLIQKWFRNGDNNYKKVRFEVFSNRPEKTLRSVLDWLNLSYENPFEKSRKTYHNLSGGGTPNPPLRPDPDRLRNTPSYRGIRKLMINFLKKYY